ncbi:MAG: hypothetical protein M1838_000894 [Thelocarpon superellum]|nr:MAG: hypothetical protein M1838_000894 [Thelocarpon superellum]
MTTPKPDITLYTTNTPNGVKISITLEELGTHKIDISKNTQKEPWFLEINPNGRIPAITDTFTDGKTVRVFESGSIQQYLVARYDPEYKISYPPGSREHIEMTNWLFFLNAGVGPMQGQANHFSRYAPEHIEYGINRYRNETRRLYRVLDSHLASAKTEYLVGNKCTIADIAHIGWIKISSYAGVDLTEFPTLKAWEQRMLARPGVERGRNVPDPAVDSRSKEEIEALAAEGRKWIQASMAADAQK